MIIISPLHPKIIIISIHFFPIPAFSEIFEIQEDFCVNTNRFQDNFGVWTIKPPMLTFILDQLETRKILGVVHVRCHYLTRCFYYCKFSLKNYLTPFAWFCNESMLCNFAQVHLIYPSNLSDILVTLIFLQFLHFYSCF